QAAEGLGGLRVETLDLSDHARLRSELERVSGEVGGFDVVINNAAIYPSKPFEDFTLDEIKRVQAINVEAGIVCVQVALPHMKAMARVWAREFGKYGVTANAISPGAFPTDAEKIHPDLVAYEKRILDSQAIKRRGRPSDIANTLMFLASDASSFITGQTINVDGGWVMH